MSAFLLRTPRAQAGALRGGMGQVKPDTDSCGRPDVRCGAVLTSVGAARSCKNPSAHCLWRSPLGPGHDTPTPCPCSSRLGGPPGRHRLHSDPTRTPGLSRGHLHRGQPASAWMLDELPASAGGYLMNVVGFLASLSFAAGLLVRPSRFRRSPVELLMYRVGGASVLT
jgi:hypothetical protein